jgi:hypothetical protein
VVHFAVRELLLAADVVKQAGGNQHVIIDVRLACGNVQRVKEHPVDVFLVVGCVFHAVQHVFFYLFVLGFFHLDHRPLLYPPRLGTRTSFGR